MGLRAGQFLVLGITAHSALYVENMLIGITWKAQNTEICWHGLVNRHGSRQHRLTNCHGSRQHKVLQSRRTSASIEHLARARKFLEASLPWARVHCFHPSYVADASAL